MTLTSVFSCSPPFNSILNFEGEVVSPIMAHRGDSDEAYLIQLSEGDRISLNLEVIGEYSDLYLYLTLLSPNDDELETGDGNGNSLLNILTSSLPRSGIYTILVENSSGSGTYNLYIDCIQDDGEVISSNIFTQGVECGQIIDNAFEVDLRGYMVGSILHSYFILLDRDDTLDVTVEVMGRYSDLYLSLALWDADYDPLVEGEGNGYESLDLEVSDDLSRSGLYLISVVNTEANGEYSLYISCTRNGERIIAGDVSAEDESSNRFNNAISIQSGRTEEGTFEPNSNDLWVYFFEADTNDELNLSLARTRGNLYLELMIVSDRDDILFESTLARSDDIETNLSFEYGGTYYIVVSLASSHPDNPRDTEFELDEGCA